MSENMSERHLRCPNCRSTQVPAAPPSPVELAADPGLDDMYDEMERIREIFAWRPGLAMEMEEDETSEDERERPAADIESAASVMGQLSARSESPAAMPVYR